MIEIKHYITIFNSKQSKVINIFRFKQTNKYQEDDIYDFIFNTLKKYLQNESDIQKAIKVLTNIGYIDVNEFTIEYSYFNKLKSMPRFILTKDNK